MTATDLLRQAQADGLSMRVTERGTLKVSGDPAALDRWAPTLKANKPALLEALATAEVCREKPIAISGLELNQMGLKGDDLERRRSRVVRRLQEQPALLVSFDVQNAPLKPERGEPVSVVIAVRAEGSDSANKSSRVPRFEGGRTGIVSAEFLIPRERFDFVLFSRMLDETSRRPS